MTAMTTLQIVALPVEGDAERSCALVERRTGARLRRLTGGAARPEHVNTWYWPIELGVATADLRAPLRRRWRSVRVRIARDLVTGRPGTVDVRVPDGVRVTAPATHVVADHPVDDGDWREFARDQLVLRHRPAEIRDLALGEFERVHLPYDVVALGERRFLVDRLMSRVDPVDALPPTLTKA
jgi:hypothetical protein